MRGNKGNMEAPDLINLLSNAKKLTGRSVEGHGRLGKDRQRKCADSRGSGVVSGKSLTGG